MEIGDKVLVCISSRCTFLSQDVSVWSVEGKVVSVGEKESAVEFRGKVQMISNDRIITDRADMNQRRDKLWAYAVNQRVRQDWGTIEDPACVYLGIYA